MSSAADWHITLEGAGVDAGVVAGAGAWEVMPAGPGRVVLAPVWVSGLRAPLAEWLSAEPAGLEGLRKVAPGAVITLHVCCAEDAVALSPAVMARLAAAGVGVSLMPRRRWGRGGQTGRPALVGLMLAGAASAVALILAAVEIETIMATGPILMFIGVALGVSCLSSRSIWALAVAGLNVATPLLLLVLILQFRLGPREATPPVLAVGALHVLAVAVLAYKAYQRRGPRYEPWQCQGCGYSLRGITGHASRCPECGVAFNASAVAAVLATEDRGVAAR